MGQMTATDTNDEHYATGDSDGEGEWCAECHQLWPCDTAQEREGKFVMAASDSFNPAHPHEPSVPVVLDGDGRCLVCAVSYGAGELAREVARRKAVRQIGWRDPVTRRMHDMGVEPYDPSKWQAIYVEAEA